MSTADLPRLNRFTVEQSERSTFRWGIGIWLLILASFLSVRKRDASELMSNSGIDLQIKLQILAWVILGAIALVMLGTKKSKVKLSLQTPLFWYAIYIFLTVASTAYSNAPALTLFRSGQLVIMLLLILSMQEILAEKFHVFVLVFLAINWLLVIMANTGFDLGQEWVRGPGNIFCLRNRESLEPWRFSSPIAHASQVSIVGAASAVGLSTRITKENVSKLAPVVLFIALTVILTISRTAIASMFGGFFVVAFLRKQWIAMILVMGILIPIAIMFTPVGEKVIKFGMRGQSVEEFNSLTGRSEIYDLGLQRAKEALPLGEGFVAGRAQAIVAKSKGDSIVHSHNLFIESAVGMGILGVISAAMVLISLALALLKVIRLAPNPTGISPGWEPAVMSLPLFGFCILDRGFAAPVAPFVFLFAAVLTMTAQLLATPARTSLQTRVGN
ncbi:MAG: O-antigen ligase family protein [Planctomycetota bacterium]